VFFGVVAVELFAGVVKSDSSERDLSDGEHVSLEFGFVALGGLFKVPGNVHDFVLLIPNRRIHKIDRFTKGLPQDHLSRTLLFRLKNKEQS